LNRKRSWDREYRTAKALVLPVLLFSFSGLAAAQVGPPVNGPDQDNLRFSVELDLVVLQATVRDRAGHAVSGLGEQDFKVYQDGAVQPVRLFRHEDTPVTIGLVVDHSGSMHEKLGEVTAAARTFVRASNPEDQMFVVNFNEDVSLGLPSGMRFSNSADELGDAIWGAPAVGATALYDAIAEALQGLQKGERDKKALIVISDGGDNASKSSLDRVLKMAEESSAVIYTIGVFGEDDPDKNPRVLRRLAHETGGEAFFPSEPKETVEICERIARDVRDQYTIGFSSMNGEPGAYHKIRVTARSEEHGKLSVRTRAGYIAGGESQPGKGAK
jgi:Ca-activated chloride channel homolog